LAQVLPNLISMGKFGKLEVLEVARDNMDAQHFVHLIRNGREAERLGPKTTGTSTWNDVIVSNDNSCTGG
jgi:hypothetical protein